MADIPEGSSLDHAGVDRRTYEPQNCGNSKPHGQHIHSPIGGLTLNCPGVLATYPNREHEKEDRAARRRALAALETLISEANQLHYAIAQGRRVDGDGAQQIADAARKATANMAIIGALADVREWDAADKETERRQQND